MANAGYLSGRHRERSWKGSNPEGAIFRRWRWRVPLVAESFSLVIDNCEHVIDAVARTVETMVRFCPGVSILATSPGAHMRIDGEAIYQPVSPPPLDFPVQHQLQTPVRATSWGNSAIQLFITRMLERRSSGQSQDELSTIAAICRRLDGLPLAIEFAAAAAAATLGVAEVLSRLDDRFALLTGGRRTALSDHLHVACHTGLEPRASPCHPQ